MGRFNKDITGIVLRLLLKYNIAKLNKEYVTVCDTEKCKNDCILINNKLYNWRLLSILLYKDASIWNKHCESVGKIHKNY